ncbi:hypothetical protein C9I98_20010 [Photobacterium sanctipauli]|uniref:Uncharacterized protein n=1 Tax=Photobacterium sanctipauli TaxID=1342794 RepID=A0A2T3NMY2_9GAMM|nr:hypothetical protein [Photobacterium sanctipauli]PSW16842.1 hypothetical protein C9I98_20010 [Photobacterium sanctipauli]
MKKQVLTAAVAAVMGFTFAMPATANVSSDSAQANIYWSGQIPGAIVGNGIALGSPTGGDISSGNLEPKTDGTFVSDIINVRAFATKDDGNGGEELDPDTWYTGAIDWTLTNAQVNLTTSGGNSTDAYNSDNLEFKINGSPVEEGTPYTTADGDAPDANITVGYTDPITGEVFPNDTVRVDVTLFAGPAGGAPTP